MSALSPAQREAFDRQGYLVLPGAAADAVAEARRRIERRLANPGADSRLIVRWGKGGWPVLARLPQLAQADPEFLRLARTPAVGSAVEDLLGPALIFRDVAILKPPCVGSPVRPHQDSAYWDVEPPNLVSAWIALTDAPEESGCLQVLPGTHRGRIEHGIYLGERPLPAPAFRLLRGLVSLTGTGDNPRTVSQRWFARAKEAVLEGTTRIWPPLQDLSELCAAPRALTGPLEPVPARAGDVILFHSLLVHGSGPNQSSFLRTSYIVSYMPEATRTAQKLPGRYAPVREAA